MVGTAAGVFGFGDNAHAQLGLGDTASRSEPARLATFAGPPRAMACSSDFSLVVDQTGGLYTFGRGRRALGRGDTAKDPGNRSAGDQLSPFRVALPSPCVAADLGGRHAVAALADGTVWSWGVWRLGGLGRGAEPILAEDVPGRVDGAWAAPTRVACGEEHALLVDGDGAAWAWGGNHFGQLGVGDEANRHAPARAAPGRWADCRASGNCSALLDESGRVSTFGHDDDTGRLGRAAGDAAAVGPVPLLGGVVDFAFGYTWALARTKTGLAVFGAGEHGVLGDGDATPHMLVGAHPVSC